MENKENSYASVWNNAEFAEVCGFYRQFHRKLRIAEPNFKDLHDWLITYGQVPHGLEVVHLNLLNLIRKLNAAKKGRTLGKYVMPWERRLKVYCKQQMPEFTNAVWQNEYAQVDVSARLVILRCLQNRVLPRRFCDYPDEMRDQYIGTDCMEMRYVMKLWPEPNIKCWICIDEGELSEFRKRWRNRAEVGLLVTHLERNLEQCTAEQKYEHQQMISFLNTLKYYFPVRLYS